MTRSKGTRDSKLSRREREIMDVLYRREKASVAEVLEDLDSPPSYSAVRATLAILEKKGHVRHFQDGPRYLYRPAKSQTVASRSALHNVVHTFFGGSTGQAVSALLGAKDAKLDDADLDELQELIDRARAEDSSQ